ncbi:MAG TPA: tetratricopeptide repeat protein [Chitinophagaceae bacterium]
MKYWFLLLFLIAPFAARLQPVDTSYLKSLYDRCIDMDENQADSVAWYAKFIAQEAAKLKFNKGDVLSMRLRGISEDLKGNYDEALNWYLKSLDAARKLGDPIYILGALNDLGYLYVNAKQPQKAKEAYLECARMAPEGGSYHSIITSYINLGGIYNQLRMHDSALLVLNEGLALAEKHHDKRSIHSLYNNIANVYYRKNEFSKALPYFQRDYLYHLTKSDSADIWLDELNLADDFTQLKKFDSASFYGLRALALAQRLQAKEKESESYAILAVLYSMKGEYKKAYENQLQWYTLDTSLVNGETNKNIAGLQERFNAKQREQQNRLLRAEIMQAMLRSRITTYVAIAAAIIALLIAVSLFLKRQANKRLKQQNELIRRQNEKLAELNYEKNSLISIV